MDAVTHALVRSLPLFERLESDELDVILAGVVSRQFAKREAVFEQGETASNFFVLLQGRLRVTQVTPEGQQVIVRIVNPGDLFGIAKALRRIDYPGTATAVMDSIVLSWPAARWDEFIEGHHALTVNVMQTLGDRLQQAQARLREMATESAERRVAHTVLRLGSFSGTEVEGGVRIDFPVSRRDIAEMTGTSLHTVSRILSAWEAAGFVEGGRQKLILRDPHRLLLIGDGIVPGLT